MKLDQKTKELLKEGKAKMESRLEIVNKYLQEVRAKAMSRDILKAGKAKKKTREEIVRNYLSSLHS